MRGSVIKSRGDGRGAVDPEVVEHDLPTVFVVDDCEAVRSEIQDIVATIGLRAEAYARGRDFLNVFSADQRGCLVLDVRLTGMSGLELQARLRERGSRLPIIFITGYGDVWTAVEAMKGGAFDFIEKPFSAQALLDRINQAVDQNTLDWQMHQTWNDVNSRLRDFTPRELEVGWRIAAGMSNKSIAKQMSLSVRTVEFHRTNLRRKTHSHSREDLIRALQEILVST